MAYSFSVQGVRQLLLKATVLDKLLFFKIKRFQDLKNSLIPFDVRKFFVFRNLASSKICEKAAKIFNHPDESCFLALLKRKVFVVTNDEAVFEEIIGEQELHEGKWSLEKPSLQYCQATNCADLALIYDHSVPVHSSVISQLLNHSSNGPSLFVLNKEKYLFVSCDENFFIDDVKNQTKTSKNVSLENYERVCNFQVPRLRLDQGYIQHQYVRWFTNRLSEGATVQAVSIEEGISCALMHSYFGPVFKEDEVPLSKLSKSTQSTKKETTNRFVPLPSSVPLSDGSDTMLSQVKRQQPINNPVGFHDAIKNVEKQIFKIGWLHPRWKALSFSEDFYGVLPNVTLYFDIKKVVSFIGDIIRKRKSEVVGPVCGINGSQNDNLQKMRSVVDFALGSIFQKFNEAYKNTYNTQSLTDLQLAAFLMADFGRTTRYISNIVNFALFCFFRNISQTEQTLLVQSSDERRYAIQMAILETLRCFPFQPLLLAQNYKDCTVQGIPLKKNTNLAFHLPSLLARNFNNPSQFDHERFKDKINFSRSQLLSLTAHPSYFFSAGELIAVAHYVLDTLIAKSEQIEIKHFDKHGRIFESSDGTWVAERGLEFSITPRFHTELFRL